MVVVAPAANDGVSGIVVGLSEADIDHLRAGAFIGRHHDRLGITVWICSAATDAAIVDALERGTLLNSAPPVERLT